jgi:hypothetical protein
MMCPSSSSVQDAAGTFDSDLSLENSRSATAAVATAIS